MGDSGERDPEAELGTKGTQTPPKRIQKMEPFKGVYRVPIGLYRGYIGVYGV